MRTQLRNLLLTLTASIGITAAAQTPYTLIVQGSVAGCTPFQQVTVTTLGNTQPLVSYTLEIFPPNCTYDTVIDVLSPTASVMVSTLCGGVVVMDLDSAAFNFIGDTAVVTINLGCGGAPDCLGIPGGPNQPGTPCNDGNPLTSNDTWDANCQCSGIVIPTCQAAFTIANSSPWVMDLTNTSTGMMPMLYDWYLPDGTSSAQSSPSFTFSAPGIYGVCLTILTADNCTSITCDTVYVDIMGAVSTTPLVFDCLGILNGPNMPGTPCNDGNPLTLGDIWNAGCSCQGTLPQNCQAAFTGTQLGPWLLSLTNQSTGVAPMSYLWTLPDGSTSTQTNPLFSFNSAGTYGICLAINAGNGCTSLDCDTVFVDNNGNISFQPQYYDCLGLPNGPNLPGTWCTDGDPNTFNDLWTPNCQCVGVTPPPSSVFVTGSVSPCNGLPYPVHIFTDIGTTPYIDTLIATDTNCVYSFLFNPFNTSGWVNVEVSCDGGLTWMWDSLGFTSTPGDTLIIDFTCGGMLTDCLGIVGGPNMPGTACNDGDTLTVQDTWTPTCQCVGVPVNYYDCLQIVNGPNLPGTPCNDNNPLTIGDTWDANCNCVGNVPQPCNADFWVLQAYTVDSVTNLPVPTPNELWIWNLSSGGTGVYTFLWSFGDGTSSTDPFPTHVYANGGPYVLCLTINDSAGCTSTYCDSVSVDANGMYTGIMGGGNDRQSGFTINVRDPLATGITERPSVLGELALWPNPVQDLLNIALVSDLQGAVSVDVIDMSGRVVRSERHALNGSRTQLTIPTNDLAPGLHVLRISNGTSSITQRFVRTE